MAEYTHDDVAEGEIADADQYNELGAAVEDHGTRVVVLEADVVTRGQLLARGERTTSSSTTTTEVGVLRVGSVSMVAGRRYQLQTCAFFLSSSVANDTIVAQIRYTTDGSTPSTSSTQLPGSTTRANIPASGVQSGVISAFYTPGTTQTFAALVTVSRAAGTGNASLNLAATTPLNFEISAMGVDPGDTGVDI